MKKYFYILFSIISMTLCLSSYSVSAAEMQKSVISRMTMERFIDDFPSLHRDLTALGAVHVQAFEAFIQEGSAVPDIDAIKSDLITAQKEGNVKNILKKHKWENNFTAVYIAIFTAYKLIIAEELMTGSSDPGLAAYIAKWRPTIHPDDLAIVRENRSKLESMFLSIGQ